MRRKACGGVLAGERRRNGVWEPAMSTPEQVSTQAPLPEAGARPGRDVRTAVVLPAGSVFSISQPNSMETVVRTLAAAMTGDAVRIFCDAGAADHGVLDVSPVPAGPHGLAPLIERLRDFRPDIVEHHQQVKQAVRLARALPDCAHLLYRHNALKAPRTPLDIWRYRARFRRMDGFVFVSEAERSKFARTWPKEARRAWSVPNPIDPEPWLASPDEREPLVAFAGRATPEKGLAVVCAALPSILDRFPKWRAILMLGDWDRHQRWAAGHVDPLRRYGDRVVVLRSAPLGEVRRRMKTAAIALTPSLWAEPFGLTAVEALAAGAALISSGRGGLREASGPYARYLTDVTPAALTAAVEDLILQPNRRLALARAGQRYVIEAHSPAIRAARLAGIRETLVANRVDR